jgi:uncharacterized protein YndB with AHSA1/START domain
VNGSQVPDSDDGLGVSGTYAIAAPAEVVFGTLTDPERTTRWLPRGMVAEHHRPNLVRVHVGEQVAEFRVTTDAEQLRMQWSSADGAGLHGSTRVQDTAAGGSTVEVRLRLPAGGPDLDRVRDLVEQSAAHLRRDVEDNFTAG